MVGCVWIFLVRWKKVGVGCWWLWKLFDDWLVGRVDDCFGMFRVCIGVYVCCCCLVWLGVDEGCWVEFCWCV